MFAAVAILSAAATSPPLTLVPGRPETASLETSALFHLWNEQLDYQGRLPVDRDTGCKIFLNVFFRVEDRQMNWENCEIARFSGSGIS